MAWLCLRNDDYKNSQMCIVTGPNDTSNNTKVGEYHTKQDVLAAVGKYKKERKSRAKILVIHYPTFYNFTDYFTGIR